MLGAATSHTVSHGVGVKVKYTEVRKVPEEKHSWDRLN